MTAIQEEYFVMRKLFFYFVAVFSVVGAVLFSANAPAQKSGARTSLRAKQGKTSRRPLYGSTNSQFEPKAFPAFERPDLNDLDYDPEVPTFPVDVDPALTLDQATQAQYQQLANQLSGYATVPNDRLNFYSAFVNSPDFTVVGWQGILEDVGSDPSGSVVTLSVIPALDYVMAYPISYTEQYLVGNDGSIQFLGSADPLGVAGQFPSETFEY